MARNAKQSKLPTGDELDDLMRRAEQGDAAALPQLRRLLDERPQIWQHVGDLARHAEEAQINLAAGENMLLRESIVRKVSELKSDLLAGSFSPLEKLLVDRIAICWIQANYADAMYVQCRDASLRQAQFLMRRQQQAHQRYLAAIKQLAAVRKLLPSAVAEPENQSGLTPAQSRKCSSRTQPAKKTSASLCTKNTRADRNDQPRRKPARRKALRICKGSTDAA